MLSKAGVISFCLYNYVAVHTNWKTEDQKVETDVNIVKICVGKSKKGWIL